MLFNSPVFLFLFLPLVLLINRWLKLKTSNLFLLLSSLIFYIYGEGTGVLILVSSIVFNYFSGLLIGFYIHKVLYKKISLFVGVVCNLSILVYYKYAFFITSSIQPLSQFQFRFEDLVLPLGISFFTFQGISYITDVYRQEVKADFSPLRVALYISYFPQLIAGPIIKYKEIHHYFKVRKAQPADIIHGINRFIIGLAKKVILADNFAIVADEIFQQNPTEISSIVAILGVLIYSLQIYFDFSAYSDMAIALGRIMGFKIPENFNYPYISVSIQDFWRRWHISLSTWFKEYLYIPLGGNRKSILRTFLNLAIVFFITGLWHGASWTFVIWGLAHGFFLIIERVLNRFKLKTNKIFGRIYTVSVVCLLWVIFRSPNLDFASQFYAKLFELTASGNNNALIYFTPYFIFILSLGIIFSTPLKVAINQRIKQINSSIHKKSALTMASSLLLLFYCITELVSSTHHPFIYFKF